MKPLRNLRFLAATLALSASLAGLCGNVYAATTLNLTAGWNLLGNGGAAPIDVAATFGDATRIAAVWKWRSDAGAWALYAPSLSSAELTLYAQSKAYDVLSSIEPKEGFWVQALTNVSLTGPEPGAATLAAADLRQGWNLIASADNKTPAQLNQGLSGSLQAAGKAMVTAWAWDAPTAQWKFYAPALDAQGGTVLSDFIASRGYLAFNTAPAATDGFWLNIGAGASVNDTSPRLKPFASSADLERFLKDALARGVSAVSDYRYAVGAPTATATTTSAPSGAGSTANFSTTNLQEAGVDEADRFKSDGRYLYILGPNANTAGSGLSILALAENAPPKASYTARLALDSQKTFSQSYLATGRPGGQPDVLVALGESRLDYAPPPGVPVAMAVASDRNWFSPWDWRKGQVELLWVNIANRAQPEAVTRLALDGYLIASRRIGETVLLVTRFTPSIPNVVSDSDPTKQAAAERLALEQASLGQLLPKWYLDGVEQGNLLAASACYQAPGSDAQQTPDLIVVTAIDIGNPGAAPRAQCLSGSSETAYVSTEALYVATTRYNYTVAAGDATLTGSTGSSALIASYPAESATDLHKFALSATGPQYRGSGSVAGHLGWEQDKKSFRMGEHQGALRIATSVGETWGVTATHRLSVLREQDGALALVAQLPNTQRPAPLGKPGEKLYAVRFVGNRGYLVTFRVTDPLYVIDLGNPADPRIAGELQIPGYSDYLHPIGEEWLLGVGKDAAADTTTTWGDGRGAWYQGVKVALFNVADASQPKEVNSIVIGKRGTQSAALVDHHAFSFLPMAGSGDEIARFTLPIERHATEPGYNYYGAGDPRIYYDWSDTGLYLFSVSRTALSQQGEVRVEQRSATSTYPGTYWYGGGDRALLRGDEVHYLHGLDVWSASWSDTSSPIKAQ